MVHKKREGLFEEVYKAVRKIPKGKVATYGQLAQMVGTRDARKVGPRTELTSRRSLPGSRSRGAFTAKLQAPLMRGKWAVSPQLVGFALHANKDPDTPCHRVVDRNGRLAPNFAFDGPREQKRRLESEGVNFVDEMHVDLSKCLWHFAGNSKH